MAEGETSAPRFDIAGLFRKKIYGVPVAILALIFAAALLYMAIRMRGGSDDDVAEDEDAGEPDGDIPDAGAGTPIFIARAPDAINLPDDTGVEEAPQETDQDWSTKTIQWLISEQGASVSMATDAITGYLTGETLSVEEGRLRDLALSKFGPPPDTGYVPTKTSSGYKGPANKQGTPPTWHTVQGKNDDQPSELARIYYPDNADGNSSRYIKANNPQLERKYGGGKGATRYPPGTKVRIPAYQTPKYFTATRRVNNAGEIARRNGITPREIKILNPGMNFPVRAGKKVRVG